MVTRRTAAGRSVYLLTVSAMIASAVACDIDFTEPGLGSPPIFHLGAILTDDDEESLRVSAFLYPGTDRHGAWRAVVDDSLRILGSVLAPERFDSHRGVYRYAHEWTVLPDSIGSPVRVRAPPLDGIDGAPPHVTVSFIRRAGPDTIVVSRRDTIQLKLVIEDSTVRSASRGDWELRISDPGTGGDLVRLRAWTPPPDVIVVPAAWLPDTTEVDLPVVLDASVSWEARNDAGDYSIETSARSTLHSVVRLVEEQPSGRHR